MRRDRRQEHGQREGLQRASRRPSRRRSRICRRAAKDKDGTKVCSDLITAELRDQISTSNCGKVVKDAIRDTDEVDLEVTKVTITGDKAVAEVNEKVSDSKDRKRTIDLEKAAGKWRVSQLPQS